MEVDYRAHLLRSLEADLIGPYTLDRTSTERLSRPPLRWYMAGFLAPADSAPIDPLEEDDGDPPGDDEDDPETGPGEQGSKQPQRLPSSIGLSVFLPEGTTSVRVTVSYAEYDFESANGEERASWLRRQCGPFERDVNLDELGRGIQIAKGVFLEGNVARATARGIADGTTAITLFLVNRKSLAEKEKLDGVCLFQVELSVTVPGGLAPRPNRRDERSRELDERIADLQFRECVEWAVGHGVSAMPIHDGERVVGARTVWLPTHEVARVDAFEIGGVTLEMEKLAELRDVGSIRAALKAIPEQYAAWIKEQRLVPLDSDDRRETRETLAIHMEWARKRIADGIDLLAGDDKQILEAFRIANKAMDEAARKRSPDNYGPDRPPKWRLFQLAFVLLSLRGFADEKSLDRKIVDLIFFPTGGGKTEAYLGVIAFTLVLRRLRGATRPDAGLGVAVLLRYTLRLLTLDQLGRAATLMCAMEELRRKSHPELGTARFAVGLWVGRSATANTFEEIRELLAAYRAGRDRSPFPLPTCPWCQTEFDPGCFETRPDAVRVGCKNADCAFALSNNDEGVPVLFVDEHIYRELPCFVVGTVDKFAMLPWRGATAKLFGRVSGRETTGFLALGEKVPKSGTKLADGLRPPELIVQDELHLISGPLGTMVGLYETAIDALSTREGVGPKIIASTATVRRANEQIRALFNRRDVRMFPPHGVDAQETFFSRVVPATDSPGRLYVGVAAPSRSLKALLIRTYVNLLGAAQKLYDPNGDPKQAADAYMTLVGYFNALRELGGMRRLLEDEVFEQVSGDVTRRIPGEKGEHLWVAPRRIRSTPLEITSRESTAAIAAAKKVLGQQHANVEHVDVALASNMISVGIDIDRLGLMVMAGQPKTASEYIQASSRVGRDVKRPGLVVTVFNLFKARDRSHYERFAAFHECFYRYVEATSVTPFSGPALERGLAGVLVAMARLRDEGLLPPGGAAKIADHLVAARAGAALVAQKARELIDDDAVGILREDEVHRLARSVIDAWVDAVKNEGVVRYSRFEKGTGIPLLYAALDTDQPAASEKRARFQAPTSLRDVEPSVHLWKLNGFSGANDGD
jgi:hypothetical protein